MKCPQCSLSTSDNRDTCPQCGLDLRIYKERLGIRAKPRPTQAGTASGSSASISVGSDQQSGRGIHDAPIDLTNDPFDDLTEELETGPSIEDVRKRRRERRQAIVPAKSKEDVSDLVSAFEEFGASPTSLSHSGPQPTDAPAPREFPQTESWISDEDLLQAESIEPLEAIEASISNHVDEARRSTQELQETFAPPVTEPNAAPNRRADSTVSPEVLDFSDADELLEERLDQMIGDIVFDVEAVKVEKPKKPAPVPEQLVYDDVEISFEIEVEDEDDSDSEIEVQTESEPDFSEIAEPISAEESEGSNPPSEHDAILEDLMSSFDSIEAQTSYHAIAPETDEDATVVNPAVSFEAVENAPTFTPSAQLSKEERIKNLPESVRATLRSAVKSNDPAVERLAALLGEAYGVAPEDLVESDSISSLQAELASELDALMGEGMSFLASPSVASAAPSQPAQPDRDPRIDALESELLEQLSALQADGMSFLGTAEDSGTTGSFKAALQQSGLVAPSQVEQAHSKSLNTDLEQELQMLGERGTTVHSSLVGPKPRPEIGTQKARPSSVSVSPGVAGVLSSLKNAVSSYEPRSAGRLSRSTFPQPSITLSNNHTAQTPTAPIHTRAIRPELPPELSRSLAARAAELASRPPTDSPATTQRPISVPANTPTVAGTAHAALEEELDALLSAELDPDAIASTPLDDVQFEPAVLQGEGVLPDALTESAPLTQAEQNLEDSMTELEGATATGQESGWIDAVQTGTFLLNDLQSIDEAEPSEPHQLLDSATEELADEIADLFDQLSEHPLDSEGETDTASNTRAAALLDEAVHTGTFLLSDFQTIGEMAEQPAIGTEFSTEVTELDSTDLDSHVLESDGLDSDDLASSPAQEDPWISDLTSEIDELASLADELLGSEDLDEELLQSETGLAQDSNPSWGDAELESDWQQSLAATPSDSGADEIVVQAPISHEMEELDSELDRLLDEPLTEVELNQVALQELEPDQVELREVELRASELSELEHAAVEHGKVEPTYPNSDSLPLDAVVISETESYDSPAAFDTEAVEDFASVDAPVFVPSSPTSESSIETAPEAENVVVESQATGARLEQSVHTGSFLIADFAALEQLSVTPVAPAQPQDIAAPSPSPSKTQAVPIEQLPRAAVVGLNLQSSSQSLDQTVQTGAFLIADLAALQSEVASPAVAEQQVLEGSITNNEPPPVVDEPVAKGRNRLEDTVQTGAFLVSDLAAVGTDQAAAREETIDEFTSSELDTDVVELSIPQSAAKRLEDVVQTGAFLVGDFQALSSEGLVSESIDAQVPIEEEYEAEQPSIAVKLDVDTSILPGSDRELGNTTAAFLVSDFESIDETALPDGDSQDPEALCELATTESIDAIEVFEEFDIEIESELDSAAVAEEIAEELEPSVDSEPQRPLAELVNTGVFLVEDLQTLDVEPEQVRTTVVPQGATSVAEELWAEATVQLVPVESILGEEIELGLGNLGIGQVDDRLLVLFYAADEELIDPTKRERHQRTIPKSDARKVESSSLTSAVKKFQEDQKVFVETQRQLAEEYAANPNPTREVFNVPLWQRIGAGIADGLVVLLGGMAAAWALFLPTEALEAAYSQGFFASGVALQYGFQILLTCYVVWIITSWALVATHGRTLGGKLFQLEVVSMKGYPPTVKHALLRALAQSVTLLTAGLGMLLALGSKRLALHDYVSKTQVVEYDFFVEQERRRALHVPQEYLVDDIDG